MILILCAQQKAYDFTKYQMAEVTESFEARMFASMRQHEEDEMEDISQPSLQLSSNAKSVNPNPCRLHVHGAGLHSSQHIYSESPATTSDDDTSFSTWKAPVSYFSFVFKILTCTSSLHTLNIMGILIRFLIEW